ncbi:hypothetical protein BV53_03005 [Candidatus Synechococcus spongiarum LMB bulk15N]|uniref:Uncharacterized protein n=1 Tax=Candidatus Synechococcus spongiarum LMB bulk15N TaxID=1943583 RepID=A0A1T1D4L1_9SYNE|nr:hypothetical protein BV53_03005 [Candidatus Synechococcus spongiarum LMB bulk15N]
MSLSRQRNPGGTNTVHQNGGKGVKEEVQNAWHAWLQGQGLSDLRLAHSVWQVAMKTYAYQHPTAQSLQ